ncbi:MAG: SMC-Scp complex subunit ScpB [Candidatus Limnocylindrales bacterium]
MSDPIAAALEVTVRDVEALLFVAERPLSRREIGTLCGIDGDRVDALLGDLEVALRDRGVRVALLGDEVRLVTAPESGLLIGRYTGAGETRVSPAAMEALAIVAYRQPVTRGVIERIRGVDSDYVIRSLIARRLIVEQGRADTPGRPILYATGFEFLERFGLASLDELPPLDAEVAARLVVPEAEVEGTDAPDQDALGLDAADPDDSP